MSANTISGFAGTIDMAFTNPANALGVYDKDLQIAAGIYPNLFIVHLNA